MTEHEKILLTVDWSRWGSEDVGGTLRCGDDGLWGHVSSSLAWLERDLLHNFGRGQELAERFPQGFEVTWEPSRD